MSDNEILVKVDGASKKFCRSLKHSLFYGVQDIVRDLNPFENRQSASGSGLRSGEFWAVNDISFELRRGECLGLIGRNGAGKTTLLKMLNGLIKPDHGRIEMRGRVGALIALGAGFNPILTGRENIFVNGSVLGLTKREIDSKIEDIIDFADIRGFIDSPVQSYSSGMQVRLGFAVATAIKPDILILDEVLAVGDAEFSVKCLNRVQEMRSQAGTIFVSHHEENLRRTCSRGLFLVKGEVQITGTLDEALAAYATGQCGSPAFTAQHPTVRVLEKKDRCEDGTLHLETILESERVWSGVRWRHVFYDANDTKIAEWRSENHGIDLNLQAGANVLDTRIPLASVRNGFYRIDFALEDQVTGVLLLAKRSDRVFRQSAGRNGFAAIQL
jgi:lipopolysaccharide transport system ATP-binding protein